MIISQSIPVSLANTVMNEQCNSMHVYSEASPAEFRVASSQVGIYKGALLAYILIKKNGFYLVHVL